jgi:TatD DNase family protein
MSHYVDVHTHLTHAKFAGAVDSVVAAAATAGLGAIVVNGLEPQSNREILAMAKRHAIVKPALGIYPLDAVCDLIGPEVPFPVPRFDVEAEIAFIEEHAKRGDLAAVGECGLDGHWVGPETFAAQERVFVRLLEIAMTHDLPVIIHTRKLEQRTVEILRAHRPKKVNFHCFGGRVALARECAEKDRWWFSIPANARVNEAFTKMLKTLPLDRLLTETDAPFLAPVRGERNEPKHVVGTVAYLAELRGMTVEAARDQVWNNYLQLFS